MTHFHRSVVCLKLSSISLNCTQVKKDSRKAAKVQRQRTWKTWTTREKITFTLGGMGYSETQEHWHIPKKLLWWWIIFRLLPPSSTFQSHLPLWYYHIQLQTMILKTQMWAADGAPGKLKANFPKVAQTTKKEKRKEKDAKWRTGKGIGRGGWDGTREVRPTDIPNPSSATSLANHLTLVSLSFPHLWNGDMIPSV